MSAPPPGWTECCTGAVCCVVRLTVQLAAYPPPRFTWYVNGVAIQQSQRHKVTYDNGVVTLIIFNAQPQDSGEYVLKVTNDLGETTCKTVLTISRECSLCSHVVLCYRDD